ncbi:MAG TPA: response regulator transcription factor [Acidimicrobiales bacterium]|nr:response regulator transcription factor [Acidimicrobiales bacterium]
MDGAGQSTAVVVDEWPLVRVGMVQALRAAGITVVAQSGTGEEGVRQVQVRNADYLLLGTHGDLPPTEAARRAKALAAPPRVVVLLEQVDRQELSVLAAAGVDAFLVRSVHPADLAAAIRRVIKGERVVAAPLVSLLVANLSLDEGTEDLPGDAGTTLTRKELEVLVRLAEGRSNREIAEMLFVTPATVKTHLAHIYAKLHVTGRQQATERAVALGLLRSGHGRAPNPAG